MGEAEGPGSSTQGADTTQQHSQSESFSFTRRNFLIGAGAGAAATAAVLGGGLAIKNAISPATTPGTTTPGTTTPGTAGAVPATMRRVALNIDGAQHDLVVDNRESLWETMNFQLGLANSNLGCDRAQCGACAVLVDGKAVNSCTVLSARLGRGQKIQSVAGLATGPGITGLHPVQRAFWLDGGFQCGICTRGFIMSTVSLLAAIPSPNTTQVAEGLSGNICRCGEYAKIFQSVKTAAADMRGEKVSYLSVAPVVEVKSGGGGQVIVGVSKEFTFTTPFATIEEFDPFAEALRKRDGILAVSGSERTVSVRWDPAKLNEQQVRDALASAGHAVR